MALGQVWAQSGHLGFVGLVFFSFFLRAVARFSRSSLSHTRILCLCIDEWSLHNISVEISVWGDLGQITQLYLVKVSWKACLLTSHVRFRAWVTVWPPWLTRRGHRSPDWLYLFNWLVCSVTIPHDKANEQSPKEYLKVIISSVTFFFSYCLNVRHQFKVLRDSRYQ